MSSKKGIRIGEINIAINFNLADQKDVESVMDSISEALKGLKEEKEQDDDEDAVGALKESVIQYRNKLSSKPNVTTKEQALIIGLDSLVNNLTALTFLIEEVDNEEKEAQEKKNAGKKEVEEEKE